MLSKNASDWLARVRSAMAAPYDERLQRQLFVAWTDRLTADDRLSLAQAFADDEEGWLSAAGRGADPATEPRAVSAVAQAHGFDLHLTDGRICLVPWNISTALEAAYGGDRALIEVQEEGRIISWPLTGDIQRVAPLVAIYCSAYPAPSDHRCSFADDDNRDNDDELLLPKSDAAEW